MLLRPTRLGGQVPATLRAGAITDGPWRSGQDVAYAQRRSRQKLQLLRDLAVDEPEVTGITRHVDVGERIERA